VESHLPILFALLRTFLILVAEAVDRWTWLFAVVFLLFALSSCALLSFELDAFNKFLAVSVLLSGLETLGLFGRFLYPREHTPASEFLLAGEQWKVRLFFVVWRLACFLVDIFWYMYYILVIKEDFSLLDLWISWCV
jgi:hypothetical protein